MAKRLMGFLLAAAMVMSVLPASVLSAAAEGENTQEAELTTVETTLPEETTAPEETTVPQEPTVPEETTPPDEPQPEPPIEDSGYKGYKISDDCMKVLKLEEGFSKKPYWDYSQWTVGYGTRCPSDMREYYSEHGITEREAEILLRNHLQGVYKDIVNYMEKNSLSFTQNQFDALILLSYNCGTSWSYDKNGTLYKALASKATGNELIRAFGVWCIAGGQVQNYLLRRRLSEANMYLNNVYSQTPPSNYCYVYYNANGGSVNPRSQCYDSNLTVAPFSVPTYEGYTFTGWYTQSGTKVTVLDRSVKGMTLYAQWENAEGQAPESNEQAVDITVKVTADDVNIRRGPGTNYTRVGEVDTGKQIRITAIAEGSGYTWGKFESGWICLKYTNYDAVKDGNNDEPEDTEPDTPPQEPEDQEPAVPTTVIGTVKANGGLRVRSGPGTGYEEVRCIPNGSKIEILEQKTVGAMTWGKISDGWVSMTYVSLTDDTTESQPEDSENNDNNNNNSSTPSSANGTITAVGGLRVRSGPGVSYSVVRSVAKGTRVQITETKTEGSTTWGKISDGWVSMQYVKLDDGNSTEQKPAAAQTGKVNTGDGLRIRSGPGTSYAVCGYLNSGATVQITETKVVGATTWGKIANGWICMDYVQIGGSDNNTSVGNTIKTVTASCLCVRKNPGTAGQVVGYLYKNSKVEILETKDISGTTWGRITSGWICLDYVK